MRGACQEVSGRVTCEVQAAQQAEGSCRAVGLYGCKGCGAPVHNLRRAGSTALGPVQIGLIYNIYIYIYIYIMGIYDTGSTSRVRSAGPPIFAAVHIWVRIPSGAPTPKAKWEWEQECLGWPSALRPEYTQSSGSAYAFLSFFPLLHSWGDNTYGQLGLDDTQSRYPDDALPFVNLGPGSVAVKQVE